MVEKPKLLPYEFNVDAYDRIIIGFPVWAGNITPPIRTFVIENNLKGKRIAAFACQSGSGAEKAFGILKAAIGTEKLDAELIAGLRKIAGMVGEKFSADYPEECRKETDEVIAANRMYCVEITVEHMTGKCGKEVLLRRNVVCREASVLRMPEWED